MPRNKNKHRRSSGIASRRKLRASIIQLSDMAERIHIENIHKRIETPSGDPAIRQLADTINAMIGRLEKAVRRQTIFISDASHEMRTPISVIKGYADLIDRWGKSDPQVLQESIEAIKMETEHMNSLIKSLLVLARGEDGNPNKRWVSLNAVSVDIAREYALLHNCDNIDLIDESEETIFADYDMILQLLRVFVDNSIKYAENENDDIQLIISGDEGCSRLTVKDNGIGVSAEDLPFIFERFYRVDKARSNRVPGFGLGLSIADMIARAHGADIAVYSELGAGMEITVSFPKAAS